MKNFLYVILIFLLTSCTSDFIEPDLKGRNMVLLSPPNNFTTTSMTNTFWWEEIKGAAFYRIQIVDSSFSYISSLVLDSMVTDVQYSFTLTPGVYQWRVRAENSSSFTDFSVPRTLHIDSTASLSNQTVILVSPANNIYTNQLTNTYKWTTLPSAVDYRFQLIDMSDNTLVTDVIVQSDSFNYTLPQGQFKWQVRAQNATSNSLYSSRLINIDNTAPGAPVISAPADNSIQPNPVVLSWTNDVSAIGDSLYVYADSLYTTTVLNVYTVNETYNFSGISLQPYYWRVKSVDNAGNWSNFSPLRKFYVQ